MTGQVVYQQCTAVAMSPGHNTSCSVISSEIAQTPKVTKLPKCVTPFVLRKPASWFCAVHVHSVLPKPQAKWLP